MEVRLAENAFVPERAHPTDAGLDIRSPIDVWIHPGEHVLIDTGVAVAIPDGCVGLLTSKSGLMARGLTSRGTIDSHYRGNIKVVLYNHGPEGHAVHRGDKVTQLVILPVFTPGVEIVDELDETDRGEGGFGSTGA